MCKVGAMFQTNMLCWPCVNWHSFRLMDFHTGQTAGLQSGVVHMQHCQGYCSVGLQYSCMHAVLAYKLTIWSVSSILHCAQEHKAFTLLPELSRVKQVEVCRLPCL